MLVKIFHSKSTKTTGDLITLQAKGLLFQQIAFSAATPTLHSWDIVLHIHGQQWLTRQDLFHLDTRLKDW